MAQLELPFEQPEHPTSLGSSVVSYIRAKSILNKATGFISGFDFTLNPYSGCTFGCSYCYAAFFMRDVMKQKKWGEWVDVKENALALLRKKQPGSLDGKSIYMSSATDPYQPIENKLQLTRSLLEELHRYHKPRLVIQTRSKIVVRDIDLLKHFGTVQVNMTITTDDEAIRKVFEPGCSSIPSRLDAITRVSQAGIPTCITMTPLLPITNPEAFTRKLLATGAQKFVVQHFHLTKGNFVAGTREGAVRLFEERRWTTTTYQQVLTVLKRSIPGIVEGKGGFSPP